MGNTISETDVKYQYYSRNLPHLFDIDKPVFITYRLKFTLPSSVMHELNRRKTEWFKEMQDLNEETKTQKTKHKDAVFFNWFDELITSSPETPQLLLRKDITDIISSAFRYHNDQRYKLLAYCIMPNHVHVLILPLRQASGEIFPLARITYTWKRYTTNQINALLGKNGSLWQQESYDHLVEDEIGLARIIEYILENPVKAGLVDNWKEWYGTWVREELM